MDTSEFDYHLPAELIAQQPPARRDEARLMIVHRAGGRWEHRTIAELPQWLRAGDLLVVNDTRVIPARIFGRKPATGGRVEALLIEERPGPPTPESAECRPGAAHASIWEVMLKAARPPAAGAILELANGRIRAEVLARLGNGRALLRLTHDRPLMDILDQEGVPPLPPYIKRPAAGGDMRQAALDRERYQTVYARAPGAIAAPTAGLHFTPAMLEALERRGVGRAAVTLHVGPGTFQPVSAATVEAHRIEPERYRVSPEAAQRIRETQASGGRIVAVGSTVVRTLETVAAERGSVAAAEGRSGLFIYPPYAFRAVQVMMTNFHLPKSTLLMMVCAFAGTELIRQAYAAAIRERYRFYSYGDCMLII